MDSTQDIEVTEDITDLIRKAQLGDQKAIERLIEKFQPDIRKFAAQVCKTNEDAEDAIQHTLFIIFSKIDSFRSLAKFTSWLFAIVKYECLRLFRKIKRHRNHIENLTDLTEATDDKLSRLQLEHKISLAISSLEPIYREVILLRDVEGLSTPETAKKLRLSTDAVKSRLHRARSIIRDQLN